MGKRFIFTIEDTNSAFIKNWALKDAVSQSKVLNNLILEYKGAWDKSSIHGIAEYKEGNEDKNQDAASIMYYYKSKQFEVFDELLADINFNSVVSGMNIDFLEYILIMIRRKLPKSESVLTFYAKVLMHNGFYDKALELLLSHHYEKSFTWYITSAKINIAKGQIEASLINLNAARAKINITLNPQKRQVMHEEYLLTYAEYTWIASGGRAAYTFLSAYLDCGTSTFKGKVNCLIGEFMSDMGQHDIAKRNYIAALELLNGTSEKVYIAYSLRGIGRILLNKGMIEDSVEMTFKALTVGKAFNDMLSLNNILASVGNLYCFLGDFDTANKVFEQKKKKAIQYNSIREIFYANYANIRCMILKGDKSKAYELIENSTSISAAFRREYYIDIWKGYLETDINFEKGLHIVHECREEAFRRRDYVRAMTAMYVEGALYMKDVKYKKKGINILREISSSSILSERAKIELKQITDTPDL